MEAWGAQKTPKNKLFQKARISYLGRSKTHLQYERSLKEHLDGEVLKQSGLVNLEHNHDPVVGGVHQGLSGRIQNLEVNFGEGLQGSKTFELPVRAS